MANLIELNEYKELEGISDSRDDLKILHLIESVSQLVKTYCGVAFVDYYSTDKVEYISVNFDTPYIFLTESPLVAVTEVQTRSSPSADYAVLDVGRYAADTLTDSVMYHSGGVQQCWPKGPNSVMVTYQAGYAQCPYDLRLAVIDLINYYKLDEHKTRQSALNVSRENYLATRDFPDHIKRVLDLYKVHV